MSSRSFRCVQIAMAIACALFAWAGSAWSQSAHWSVRTPLAEGRQSTLELTFEDAQPEAAVSIPTVDDLVVIGNPGRSSRIQMSQVGSGVSSQSTSVTLAYSVRPKRKGRIDIPAFDVVTDRGRLRIPAASFEVGTAVLENAHGGESTPLEEAVVAILRPSDRRPYAGEVFDLEYLVMLEEGRRGELLGSPMWQDPEAISESWSEGRSIRMGNRSGMHFQTRALVPQAGPTLLPPVEQEVAIETGKSRRDPFFDSFFGSSRRSLPSIFDQKETVRVVVATDPLELEVQPLPKPAPQGFSGAVGRFKLESRLVPENPRAGEPVTWTLSLEGTGNWPSGVALPSRSVPADFRTLQPHLEREFEEGDRFNGRLVEDLVLVPSKPGVHVLDPVRFVYFDPEMGRYETSIVEPFPLEVAAAPMGSRVPAPPSTARPQPTAPPEAAQIAEVAPAVLRLPADVMSGSGGSQAPLPLGWLAAATALPLGGFLATALVLGLRRARETDPQRERREAWEAIGRGLDALDTATDRSSLIEPLRAWQDASARFFEFETAAPSLSQWKARARDLASVNSGPGETEAWTRAWEESDRVLYGGNEWLEEGWCIRARALFEGLTRPRFAVQRTLMPKNLFPPRAAAIVALCLFVLPSGRAGAEGAEAYRAGDFEAARVAFSNQVREDPENWVARYNLGLSDAQLGSLGRALAQTTAAFLAAPRDEAVRWNLALFEQNLGEGVVDAQVARVAFGSGIDALARQAPPSTWQWVWVLGATLLFLGAGWGLRLRHEASGMRRGRWPARSLALVGLLACVASSSALVQYGGLLDVRAALVADGSILRSVPTDAETPQKHRPLQAGTLVVQGREFLGWTQVSLASGESGWVRSERIVPLYAGPAA